MKTLRTISNISYNSPEYFASVTNDLLKRGVIDWAYWIVHQPDTDDTKQHIHFVLKPSSRIDTAQLRLLYMEIDPVKAGKYLTCTTKFFFTNSISDWLLYAVHDVGYLISKGLTRNITYEYEDLRATDYDALRMDWNSIDRMKYSRLAWLNDAVQKNVPFAVLVQNGVVPIAMRAQYEMQYRALQSLMDLDSKHDGRVDENGEIDKTEELIPADDIIF